jgi:hypothetical protein
LTHTLFDGYLSREMKKPQISQRRMLTLIRENNELLARHVSEIKSLRDSLAHQVRKNDEIETRIRQAYCLAVAGQNVPIRRSHTAGEDAMLGIFSNIQACTQEQTNFVAMSTAPPCHSLPREKWCDRNGPGGFMGHTCYPKEIR